MWVLTKLLGGSSLLELWSVEVLLLLGELTPLPSSWGEG